MFQMGSKLGSHLKIWGSARSEPFEPSRPCLGEVGVTECVGGSMELEELDLRRKYELFCNPRLNYGMGG
jgi:3-deoxy-7-phosphoheptulonate synthase